MKGDGAAWRQPATSKAAGCAGLRLARQVPARAGQLVDVARHLVDAGPTGMSVPELMVALHASESAVRVLLADLTYCCQELYEDVEKAGSGQWCKRYVAWPVGEGWAARVWREALLERYRG